MAQLPAPMTSPAPDKHINKSSNKSPAERSTHSITPPLNPIALTPSQEASAWPQGVHPRRFMAQDLEAAEALTREVQWPHRREDWAFGLALGEGWVVERHAQVVGSGMRWQWGQHHACLGMVIVSQALRGQGMGHHLVQALLSGLDDRSVLLHATAAGRGLYERAGFQAVGVIRQHQGVATPAQLVALPEGQRLRPLGRTDAKTLVALDAQAAGMPRDALVRQLLTEGETVVLARGSTAVGFAVLRRFGRGFALGPVVAPDLAGAKALIGYGCSRCAGRFLRVDVEAGSGLPEWLEAAGLQGVDTAAIMVRGELPRRGSAHGGWALVNQAMG